MSLALIIDDEVDLCRLMQMTLKKMHIESMVAYDFVTAVDFLSQHKFDFCLTDLRLPDGSGLDIVKLIAKDYPATPVAVITAHGSMDLAIEALKLGAFDFVNKPLELPRLRQLVENAIKVAQNSSVSETQVNEQVPDLFADTLIGQSPSIIQLKQTIQKLARSQAPVFLWGESGTGKEVVAKLIHELSPRHQASFVPVNCGAIPSELMESEFFGHKKGSFTGATADKEGLFQQANGGTLFLDEVADLPLPMQVKLLRAIQEKKVRPIGGTQEIPVDIRLLSATHKDLAKLVDNGNFRQDLYYRINVIEVKLPSLNERRDDVPMLAEHFLQLITKDWGLEQIPELTQSAKQALLSHSYSGNVRELRNILERAITLSDGVQIDVAHLNLQTATTSPVASEPLSYPELPIIVDEPVATPAIDATIPLSRESVNTGATVDLIPKSRATQPIHQPLEPALASPAQINPSPSVKPSAPNFNGYSRGSFDTNVTINPCITLPKPKKNDNVIQTLPPMAAKVMQSANQTASRPHHMNSTNMEGLPPEGLEEYLLNQERQLIIAALAQSGGNKTQAAKLLNTTFRSLRYRMKKLEIDGSDD